MSCLAEILKVVKFLLIFFSAVLCGGYIHKMDEFGDEESDVTDETWLFTASDCRLRPLPPMKHPREGHAAVFLNGKSLPIVCTKISMQHTWSFFNK